MEIKKYQTESVLYHIRHNLRELPNNKSHGNQSINPNLTGQNYSLINRGNTAKEVNDYRLNLENEIFKYNRKNLVHAVEVVIQCPNDCPTNQKDAFFRESFNYICSTLPMGERCVFVAQVHKDEKSYSPDGEMISKDHLHIMYTPAVKDTKHEKFQYKLCANDLTKKSQLFKLHPGLQQHLDNVGIHATVFNKQSTTNDGKTIAPIALSASQLKALTKNTGIVLDKPITIEELSKILVENVQLKQKNKELEVKVEELAAFEKLQTEIEEQISEQPNLNDWDDIDYVSWEMEDEHEWER